MESHQYWGSVETTVIKRALSSIPLEVVNMQSPYCFNVVVFNQFGKVGFEIGYLLNMSIRYDLFDCKAFWSITTMKSFCLYTIEIIQPSSMIILKNMSNAYKKELIVQLTVLKRCMIRV